MSPRRRSVRHGGLYGFALGCMIVALAVLAAMVVPSPDAQTPPSVSVLPGCTVEPGAANAGGTLFNCPGSEWIGSVDHQCGVYVPGEPNKLNCNWGAGSSEHRGYVVVTPDVGKGMIVEDGYLHKLALFRAGRHGGTEFRIRPRFERGLIACNQLGRDCVDVLRALRSK